MTELRRLAAPLWAIRVEIEKEVRELTSVQQRLDAMFAAGADREEEIALLADLYQRLITLTGTNQRVLETLYDLTSLTDELRQSKPA
jgi:uncharacterized protein YbaP (TraB family)